MVKSNGYSFPGNPAPRTGAEVSRHRSTGPASEGSPSTDTSAQTSSQVVTPVFSVSTETSAVPSQVREAGNSCYTTLQLSCPNAPPDARIAHTATNTAAITCLLDRAAPIEVQQTRLVMIASMTVPCPTTTISRPSAEVGPTLSGILWRKAFLVNRNQRLLAKRPTFL